MVCTVHPGLLQNQVLTLDLIALLLRHGVIAPHTLLGLFGLKRLLLNSGFHTGHAFVVTLTVMGPHFLHTVKGCIFALPIALLAYLILVGVPLFLLVLPWRIHGPVRLTGLHTRPPRFSICGMDSAYSV